MNWKQLVSMALAGAVAAVVTVVAKQAPVYAQAGIVGFVGAIIHKINIWGGTEK